MNKYIYESMYSIPDILCDEIIQLYETEKIKRLLHEHNGYLPYNDKSNPEDIYEFFGMSKKTFKMTIGNLYKQRKIRIEKTGIKSID